MGSRVWITLPGDKSRPRKLLVLVENEGHLKKDGEWRCIIHSAKDDPLNSLRISLTLPDSS